MATPVSPRLMLALTLALAAASSVSAQTMRDPTRPPAGIEAAAPSAVQPATAPVLQSVIIGTGGRRALVSGRLVELGDRIGNGRVVRITESQVVLRTPEGTVRLELFPQVRKRAPAIRSRPDTPPDRRGDASYSREISA